MLLIVVSMSSGMSLSSGLLLIGIPAMAYNAAVSNSRRLKITSRGATFIAWTYFANFDSANIVLTAIFGACTRLKLPVEEKVSTQREHS
jgi:hypothetical protein